MSTKEKELKEFTATAISVTPRASERIKKSMKIEDKEVKVLFLPDYIF